MAPQVVSSNSASRNYSSLFHRPRGKGTSTVRSSKDKAKFDDVGGDGDCGFRAVAAGVIDNFFNYGLNETLITKLLNAHFLYFPNHRSSAWGTKPTERMKHLTEQVRMGELVTALAYTLRQIAVDEMCDHPAQYRGAFVTEHEDTSPAKMREAKTWIDESAIVALGNVLDIPITVQVSEPRKELFLTLDYNEAAKDKNQGVVMRLRGKHYVPKLVSGERFSTVRSYFVASLKPAEHVYDDRSMTEILKLIEEDDARIIAEFDDVKTRIAAHVADGSIDKEFLINVYIQNMSFTSNDYLSGRIAHVCNERGNNDFKDAINHAQQGKGVTSFGGKRDEPIVEELVHAIARAITIGQINGADVFEQIEQRASVSGFAP